MSQSTEKDDHVALKFTRKVWIAVAITAFVAILLLLLKTLFNPILLISVGALLAIYFHGFAGLIQRYIHLPSNASIIVSVLFNLLLLVGFFWFAGGRLSQQITQMSEQLPQSAQQLKQRVSQNPLGSKVVSYLQSSEDSQKTKKFVKQFFTSTFGIVSDLYIVLLIGLFLNSGPPPFTGG
jgi:predicted PurR-regulated permease PerM